MASSYSASSSNATRNHNTRPSNSGSSQQQPPQYAQPPPPAPPASSSRSRIIHPLSRRHHPNNTPYVLPIPFPAAATSVDAYEKLNRVGEGTYGIVYRARARESGQIVALKRIRMEEENEGMPLSSLREISLLRALQHENIVKVVDVVVGSGLDNIFMVMEYCDQDMGSLMDNVICKTSGYRTTEVKCLMLQLLRGLAYLHQRYIIHRDLKLTNLLLTSGGVLKIADFGLARKFSLPPSPMTPKVVTLWYRAPELLLGEQVYTTAIDMWSVGCIFGELLQCAPLLPGKTERHQLELICRLLGTPTPRIWPGMDALPLARAAKLPKVAYSNVAQQFRSRGDRACALLLSLLTYHPASRADVWKALDARYFDEEPRACAPVMLPVGKEGRVAEEQEKGRRREEQYRKRRAERWRDAPDLSPAKKRGGKRGRKEDGEEEEEDILPLGAPAYKQFSFS
ncbi:Cyclin-dependent kinase 10 [Geranomyces variabilis]|nr:Cyclin-dependent kinase 10 [Geranomyces variabilis]